MGFYDQAEAIPGGLSDMTDCIEQLNFGFLCGKEIRGGFDGGELSTDGGVMLVREADRRLGLTSALAACMDDPRDQLLITHELETMLAQRVYQIACGYEDCNDADDLRFDPAFKTALGRLPESGTDLASQPTLCRFENSIDKRGLRGMAEVLVTQFTKRYASDQECLIVLDFDATDDPTHGQQQFAEFHPHYDNHCYLPLIVTAQVDDGPQELLAAVLRRGLADAASGVIALLKRLIPALRRACPKACFVVRADAGFAKPELYNWCEHEPLVYYDICLQQNSRLAKLAAPYLQQVRAHHEQTGQWQRIFAQEQYQAESWPHPRRVVLKAEVTINDKGETKDNPRFVVTNLTLPQCADLYAHYAQRGDASENRIKELKNGLKSDRTSCHLFLPNALRLMLHAAAYLLHCELRRGLQGTELADAQVTTLQRKLLKLGVRVRETARKTWMHFASNCPMRHLWPELLQYLRPAPA